MINRLAWKIRRKLERIRIKLSKNKRPSSRPFISGDGFRSIANHIHEKGNLISNANSIKDNDIIFVESSILEFFFKDIHPKIKCRYILISHNGDLNIDDKMTRYIDDKIIHWFAQNCLIKNSKITPIPIGLENAHYGQAGHIRLWRKIQKYKIIPQQKILVGFNVQTNQREREIALNTLKQLPFVDIISREHNQERYFKLMKNYKFIASPPGNGVDCHRTWEALYLDLIPIVKQSFAMQYFKDMGLPISIVDDWCRIKSIDFLEDTQNDLPKINRDMLEINYWIDKIKKYQHGME